MITPFSKHELTLLTAITCKSLVTVPRRDPGHLRPVTEASRPTSGMAKPCRRGVTLIKPSAGNFKEQS